MEEEENYDLVSLQVDAVSPERNGNLTFLKRPSISLYAV